MKRLTNPPTEKGQSLLELSLVLVFLLILMAGVIDLGRMMYEYLTMRDAAQEGAGYGAAFPSYCAQIEQRIKSNLPDENYAITIHVNNKPCSDAWNADKSNEFPINGCVGKTVSVTIFHESEITMPFLSAFTGTKVPMQVVIEDRIVRPACLAYP